MADDEAVSSTTSSMDLYDAFDTFETCKSFFRQMIHALKGIDDSVVILVLEALCCIEQDIENSKFVKLVRSEFLRGILRDWRCNGSLSTLYSQPTIPDMLKSFLIFKKWKIPMFVGASGRKQSLTEFKGDVEDIVTSELKAKLIDEMSLPLNLENILDGSWYKVVDDSSESENDDEEVECISVEELCDKGLRQGEIINFEDDINVILYAADYTQDQGTRFSGLKKPTVAGLKKNGSRSSICLLIFVPKFGKSLTADDLQRLSVATNGEDKDTLNQRMSSRYKVDLMQAFAYEEHCRAYLNQLANELSKIQDPTVHMLAIEGFFRLAHNSERNRYLSHTYQFPRTSKQCPQISSLTNFLRCWRQKSHLPSPRNDLAKCLLRKLTVFETLSVPMVLDSCGQLELMHSFLEDDLESIKINGETQVVHVTHREQAKEVAHYRRFEDYGENTTAGVWFEIVGNSKQSVYGCKGFRTTLSQLGVKGLEQGEIVYNKYGRNVILYATDDMEADFEGLKKLKKDNVKEGRGDDSERNAPHVHVSIFVPSRLVPDEHNFWDVMNEFVEVNHGPFCLLEKRDGENCPDKAF